MIHECDVEHEWTPGLRFTFAAFVIIVFEVGGAVFWRKTTVSDTKTLVLKHVNASWEYTREERGVFEPVRAIHSLPHSGLFHRSEISDCCCSVYALWKGPAWLEAEKKTLYGPVLASTCSRIYRFSNFNYILLFSTATERACPNQKLARVRWKDGDFFGTTLRHKPREKIPFASFCWRFLRANSLCH